MFSFTRVVYERKNESNVAFVLAKLDTILLAGQGFPPPCSVPLLNGRMNGLVGLCPSEEVCPHSYDSKSHAVLVRSSACQSSLCDPLRAVNGTLWRRCVRLTFELQSRISFYTSQSALLLVRCTSTLADVNPPPCGSISDYMSRRNTCFFHIT